MEIFSIGGMLPLLVIFAVAIYSMAVVGFAIVRMLSNRPLAVESESLMQPTQGDKPALSGLAAVALSAIALISEIVLLMARSWPENIRVSLIVVLLPVLVLFAFGGIALGSATLTRGKWNLIGVAIGMVVLVALSIWLLSPVIFPK
jgi:hypothetical protein